MDLSAILSSQGLAVAIVVAAGFGIWQVFRWMSPRVSKLCDTACEKATEFVDHHNTMVTTLTENNTVLTENTTATKDLLQGISVTLDGHGSMLKEHRERLESHSKWLRDIHSKVTGAES